MTSTAMANWGDIPTWISAFATLIALIFAAVAAVSAHNVYKIESHRDRLNAEERKRQADFARRAQAALVSAWWAQRSAPDNTVQWGAYLRNASETPIYQARVSVAKLHEPDIRDGFDIAVVPPISEPIFSPSSIWNEDGSGKETDFRVEVTFTDSAGVRWIRDQQGQLSEVLPELTIWTDTQRTDMLDHFTADFLSSHQVTVRFSTSPIEKLQNDFLAAIDGGKAPDILIGPHDWIGRLVAHGAIEEIQISPQRRAAFVERAIEAMTYNGVLYGVPYAADSIALLRNLDLAPEPPATVENMISTGRSLCAAGRADEPLAIQVGTGDGFHIYPWYSSVGGRIFCRTTDGSWDPEAIAGQSAKAAFRRISDLGEQGCRILRREIDREAAIEMFINGRTPYLVCAPWAVGSALAADMKFGVSPVPPFDNADPAKFLVSVNGFFLASAGGNKKIAQDLIIDYLTRMDVALELYAAQPRMPALRAAVDQVYTSNDQNLVYRQQFETGELIPSSSDVAELWAIFNKAQVDVVAGANVDSVVRALYRSVVELNGRSRTAPKS